MTTNSLARVAAATVVVILSTGCGRLQQARELYADLAAVRTAVQRLTGASPVEVRLANSTTLAVQVVNSPLQALPAPQRQAKARELAAVAYDAYTARAALSSVRVDFLTRGGFSLLSVGVSVSHGFDPRALHDRTPARAPRT